MIFFLFKKGALFRTPFLSKKDHINQADNHKYPSCENQDFR
ncbi:hypothetical protein CHCC14821_0869 [Bacillus paralicheniformis]|nr:hypothetical protein CHCC14821_0869 [Bacillus paralicheniformis]